MDHLTQMKIRYGVTEPDDATARGIILAMILTEWLESRTQQEPELKQAT